GRTNTLTTALSGNLFNTRNAKATLRAGVEARRHKSYRFDILETEDDIRQGFLNASYLWRSGNTVVYNSNRISKGLDVLGASNQGDPLNTRAAGDPEAWIVEPLLIVQFRPIQDNTV